MEMHKEIKMQLTAEGSPRVRLCWKEGRLRFLGDGFLPNNVFPISKPQVTNITKAVSEAWRSLSRDERGKYEDLARRDKERYDLEKANYTPPRGMSLTAKRPREPGAPRCVMLNFV